MAGAWEGVGEEEYGLQWDVDRVDLDFKTGGDEDLEDGCGDCGVPWAWSNSKLDGVNDCAITT